MRNYEFFYKKIEDAYFCILVIEYSVIPQVTFRVYLVAGIQYNDRA